MKKNDLSGKQIGYWDVGEAFHKGNKIYYHCTCRCGKKRDVQSSSLNTGKSYSCGCHVRVGKVEDITGQDIGWLHIEEKLIINNRTFWRCTCQCGKHAIISQHAIHDAHAQSCGCKGYGVGSKIKEGLISYCVDGTYIPGLKRTALNKNNTSGCRGVSYRADRNKWRAYIKFQRKDIFLGNFDNYEDAVMVRKIAEKEYFGKYIEEEEI